jgi:hypothetical protein
VGFIFRVIYLGRDNLGGFMKKLSIFKIRFCICELVLISILAVTGVFVFAVGPAVDDNKIADVKTAESSSVVEVSKKDTSDVVPVVVLDDGKTAQVVSLSDFLKLAQNPNIDAVVPVDQVKNMVDLIRLQNSVKNQETDIKVLEKLEKIVEKMDKKPTQDAWWKEGWNGALKMPKELLRSIGVNAVKYLVGGTICGIIIIGGVVLTYKYIVLPTWCWSGVPGFLQSAHDKFGVPIKTPLYEVCNNYWDLSSSIPLDAQMNGQPANTRVPPMVNKILGCNCDAKYFSQQCFDACFPGN